jgi:TDG/mug DNA glycosylase family protein
VLFCGINPGLYSAATGFHFARPGNRFWPALHAAGLTPRLFHPSENARLLELGYGLTNLVNRGTAAADELSALELTRGGKRLAAKVRRFRPRAVAFVGLGAYRTAFGRPQATLGLQPERLEGAQVWVLPSPSGLNANYQLPQLVELFRTLRLSMDMAEKPKLDQTIREAIAGRHLVSFELDGLPRIGEPHDYGVKDSVPRLLFYQVGGKSSSGKPLGWREALIAKVSGMKILDQRFAGTRPAPSGRHKRWDKLLASVSTRESEDGD